MKKFWIIFLCFCCMFLNSCKDRDEVVKINNVALERFKNNPPYSYNREHYPVKIENLNSRNERIIYTFDKPPERIVAVWQNSIETLLALGVGDRVVAAMGLPSGIYLREEYQEQYKKIPYTGLELLDMESLVMHEPDFILGWYSTFDSKTYRGTDFWHARGVKTYIATTSSPKPNIRVLEKEYDYILDLGKILDRSERARQLVDQMRNAIDYVTERTKNYKKRPRALIISTMGNNIHSWPETSLAGDLVKKLNAIHLENTARTLSKEQVRDLEPDVIFVVVSERHYGMEKNFLDAIYKEKAYQDLSCVKNKRVYTIPLNYVYSPGVRTFDGIDVMARGLYPELYSDKK